MSEKRKKVEREYWLKVQEARKYRIDLEKIVKKDKIREESTRKIIKAAQIAILTIENFLRVVVKCTRGIK